MTYREPVVGDRLGRYELVEVLGRGGMGTVFVAHDESLERQVAVKVINPALAEEDDYRERFRREAVALSQLDSDHVVAVYDHGEQDGAPYLVTQLVRGGDLMALLRSRGALEPAHAIELTGQVLEGLGDAHAAGIVHRDVKPSNVLLKEGGRTTYLCDFGIATSPGQELTRTGALVGSFAYMAPERHSGDTAAEAGVPADVYAVGCLLWQMLTGAQPYIGTDAEVAMGHIHGPVPQLPGRDDFTKRLNAVLRRSMAKEPKQRYASAKAMRSDLVAIAPIVPGRVDLPDVTSVRQRVAVPPRRSRRLAGAGLLGVALLVGAVLVAMQAGGLRLLPATMTPDSVETTGPAEEASEASEQSSVRAGATLRRERRAKRPAEQAGSQQRGGSETLDELPQEPVPEPGRTTKPSTPALPDDDPARVSARFRCWDGDEVRRRSSCDWPVGWQGATYLFPGAGSVPNCERLQNNNPRRLEFWICQNRYPDGTQKTLTFQRWTTVDAAQDYFWNQRYDPDRFRNRYSWTIDGETAGVVLSGRTKRSGDYNWARIYSVPGTLPWSVSAQARTVERRNRTTAQVSFRPPSEFRGVRLR